MARATKPEVLFFLHCMDQQAAGRPMFFLANKAHALFGAFCVHFSPE